MERGDLDPLLVPLAAEEGAEAEGAEREPSQSQLVLIATKPAQ